MSTISTPAGLIEAGMIVTGKSFAGKRRVRVEVELVDAEAGVIVGLIMGRDGGAYEGSFLGRKTLDPRSIELVDGSRDKLAAEAEAAALAMGETPEVAAMVGEVEALPRSTFVSRDFDCCSTRFTSTTDSERTPEAMHADHHNAAHARGRRAERVELEPVTATRTTTSGDVEHSHADETVVRNARRALIDAGAAVSLIAFDSSREVYAFDRLELIRAARPVSCDTHVERGAHAETPECRYPHELAPAAAVPSMTAAETLDPREARR